MRSVLNFLMIVTMCLLILELFNSIPRTIKMFTLIARVKCVVNLSKVLISTGLRDTLKSGEKLVVKTWPCTCVIDKEHDVIDSQGLILYLRQNVANQIKPILDNIVQIIYHNSSHLFFSKHMIKRCKKIENEAIYVQELIDIYNMKGVTE